MSQSTRKKVLRSEAVVGATALKTPTDAHEFVATGRGCGAEARADLEVFARESKR